MLLSLEIQPQAKCYFNLFARYDHLTTRNDPFIERIEEFIVANRALEQADIVKSIGKKPPLRLGFCRHGQAGHVVLSVLLLPVRAAGARPQTPNS